MNKDYLTDRPFGVIGAVLYGLILASCLMTVKDWVETPLNQTIARHQAKEINLTGLPFTPEQFQSGIEKSMRKSNTRLKIDLPGTLLWTFALLACLVRSTWSPPSVICGGLFKLWANLYVNDWIAVGMDLAIMVLAIMLWAQWRRNTP